MHKLISITNLSATESARTLMSLEEQAMY